MKFDGTLKKKILEKLKQGFKNIFVKESQKKNFK